MFEPPPGAWEIVPYAQCSDKDHFIDYLQRPEFVRFLRKFKQDRKVMAHLRGVLTPPYQISIFRDDEVIDLIAWRVAARQLAIRMADKEFGSDVISSGSEKGGGGGSGGARKAQEKKDPQPKTSPTPSTPTPSQPVVPPSTPVSTKSWFAITVVEESTGSEKPVEGLMLICELPDLGKTGGLISKRAPVLRFDNLNPGGTGNVLATSDEDDVWEVTADVN